MATNKQREAERRRLQQQLAERRAKELARRRFTLISSVVGSLAVIALIVVVIVAATSGGDDKKKNAAGASTSPAAPTSSAPTSSAAAQCGQKTFPTKTVRAAKGAAVTFQGVTVKGAADLGGKPVVTSKSTTAPTKVQYKDLVVGKGAAAKATSCVDVEYLGVLYKTGSEFDSSWKRGSLAEFSLTGVIPGFTEGIGGSTTVPPMKVGGRRLMIIPSALAYGAQASTGIPANSPLVFIVDLVKVS